MKKLLVIALLAGLIAACGSDNEATLECPPTPIAIDINEIEVAVNNGEYQANTLISYDKINVSFEATGTNVYSSGDEFDENKTYAENCITLPVVIPANNKLTQLNIYSSADFNTDLAAGSSLNNVFSVIEFNIENRQEAVTIAKVRELLPIMMQRYFNFTLNTAPEFESSHVFYIEISLDNGKQFLIETPEILLSN
ncbi:hypothetical protein [Pseudoalteromonas sp. H105]|jgi:hypothetical protein|uniref:hypothetical protein n=1 Tax=Pseudoalteromonas sp. H105 TaxID=1348393 RepID=UPI000732169F|nr:hypothetical protein [Pseudoalteromonas sp. H105]KTF13016.1 hypothetical protein ATS75_16495 [Pseudoalteromonas sp. H105]